MKKLSLLFVFALMALSVGCGGNASPSASPSASASAEKHTIELTVVTSYGGDDGNRQNYEKAYTAYEAASGNSINDNSSVSNEDWKTRVMTSFDEGTEPDILFYFTGADADGIIQNDKVVSIEEIRAVYPDYASNMKDDMLPVSPYDGKQYAVPVNGYWEGLYVNKKVLAECGVEIPNENTSWEQFMADCQKIADKGYTPIAASLMEIPHYWFEFCVYNNGDVENHAAIPSAASDPIGQTWAAGLNDVKDLYMKGFFPEKTTTDTNAVTDVLMIDNKAAFMIDGSWKIGWFSENASDINNFTVTYVPGKGERKSTDIIGGISMGYFITRKAWDNPEKQAACVEFISAMTTDDVVASFGATAITALKNEMTPPSDANSLVMDALAMTHGYTYISAAAGDSLSPNSRGNLFGNVINIVTDKITAEKAINDCLMIQD